MTAEIQADGPVARRGTLRIAVRLASTASRPVSIEATTSATHRAIAIIRTTEAVLPLVDTIDTWMVALDPTQREFVIGDRGGRSQVPIARILCTCGEARPTSRVQANAFM